MTHIIKDRVRDTSVTQGTGPLTVSGVAPTRYQTFNAVAVTNDTIWIATVHQSANEWEVALATYSGTNTLTRTTVLASSNGGSPVAFSAGTKDVIAVHPANEIYAFEFTSTQKGLVPASGGGSTNFLRADGTWAVPPGGGGGGNAFSTIAVSGQSDVVADSASDTLTLVAGTNVTITTNAGTDTITINAGGGGGITTEDAQDAVGTILTDSTTIDFTYDDATPSITAIVINDSITFARMQNIATDRLIGRDTAASGDPEEISLNATLEFTGAGAIQRAALTGDVTASAGSNATTIANNAVTTAKIINDAVTYAKIQNVSATDRILGRDTAGAGDVEELTATGGLEFTGTGIQTSAFTGDVTKSAGGTALTIANDAVTYAKMQNVSAASKLLGRGDSGAGDPQEITLGTNLTMSGTTLNASGGGGTPGGADTNVQFNEGGAFGGDAEFTWDTTNKRLRLNHTANISFDGISPTFAAHGTSAAAALGVARWTADGGGARVIMGKSRGATAGTFTVVQADDTLGEVYWVGADGDSLDNAAWIRGAVDGTPGNGDMPGRLVFGTTPDGAAAAVERMRIDQAGRVVVGGAAAQAGGLGLIPRFQVVGPGGATASQLFGAWSADSLGGAFSFVKSRHATIGSHTVVNSGDALGGIYFLGSDGTDFEFAAYMEANVDGTPGNNDMPGRLAFFTTPDGSATAIERMRISNNGQVGVGTTSTSFAGSPTRFGVAADVGTFWLNRTAAFGNNSFSVVNLYTKTRHVSDPDGDGAVTNGDALMEHRSYANDGSGFNSVGAIRFNVSGTVSDGIVPTNFSIVNTDSAGSTQTRLFIAAGGRIEFLNHTAVTAAVGVQHRLQHTTSGTAASGFGVGTEYLLEGADGSVQTAAQVDVRWTDAAADSEDADLVVQLQAGGGALAEKFRVVSDGTFNANSIKFTASDAGFDALFGWDDSAGTYKSMLLADIATEGAPAAGDFLYLIGAEGDLRKVNWSSLPGAGGGISNVVEDATPELGGTLESNNQRIEMEMYAADANGQDIWFVKSRNASIGSHTVVQSGDVLGNIYFKGSDGTNFEVGAQITAAVDGTPGNDDMPGRLMFYTTPDAGVSPTERFRIKSDGTFSVNNNAVGLSYADEALDVLWGWDDSAGTYKNMTNAVIATEASPAAGDFLLLMGAEGDLRKVDWDDLPAGGGGISNVSEDTDPELGGTLNSNNFDIILEQYSADAVSADLIFHKSRNAVVGAHTVVQSGDDLGRIIFFGSDGADMGSMAAAIVASVDGTPGSNDMPGRLSFWTTADGAEFPSERLRINNAGRVLIGTTVDEIVEQFATAKSNVIIAGDTSAAFNFSLRGFNGPAYFTNTATKHASDPAGHGAFSNNDTVGAWECYVSDGTDTFVLGAAVHFRADGTQANDSTPTRIAFYTAATNDITERMRIDSAGLIQFGTSGSFASITGGGHGNQGQVRITDGSGNLAAYLSNDGLHLGSGEMVQFSSNANLNGGGEEVFLERFATGGLRLRGETAITNTVLDGLRLRHSTSGTAAAGIGVGISFEQDTGSDNYEVGAAISAVTTDVTSTSEDFDVTISTMAAGAAAAERLRIGSGGVNPSRRIIENEVILTDGANITLDSSLGNTFKVTAAGNRTIDAPTNKPASGKVQKIVIAHEASGADRTLTLATGSAGAFRFGTDITSLTATTSGLVDYIGCIYNDADDRWDVVSYVKGF